MCFRGEAELSGPFAKFLVLGLGLLFLGKQVGSDCRVLSVAPAALREPF